MNLYYRALGLGEGTIGRILSAGSLGTVLAALPAAVWVDRVPAQVVFVAAALGFVGALGAQLATSHWAVLALAAAITRALFTVHWVAAGPFFMRNAGDRDRLELFSFAMALETLATVVSAAGVGALADAFTRASGSELHGLRLALLAAAAAALLAVLPFARIRSGPPAAARRAVRDYFKARNWPLLGRLTLPAFLVGCGAGLIIPFLNLYFRDRFGQPPRSIGAYFSVAQLITMLGYLAGPLLARRIGSVRAVVATELLSIPFFLILALARDLRLAVAAFWIRGALMNMNHPVSASFSMSVVDPDDQTVTNSVRELAWNSAWMVSTQVGGVLIERAGYALPMFITMSLYAVAATLFFIFFGRMAGARR
jgi:predicted MFS family arabinose efflux permease